jgi:cell division initiation protein
MIDLTPLEVRKKKGDFPRAIRGYESGLVDEFLDVVADRLEELVRENMGLKERVARLEQEVTDYRGREQAMTEALVTAQQYGQNARGQAEREAEVRIREGEAEAERIRAEAYRDREREEESLRRLRARRAHLIDGFRAYLERELRQLAVEAEALSIIEAPARQEMRPPAPPSHAPVTPAAPTAPPPPAAAPEKPLPPDFLLDGAKAVEAAFADPLAESQGGGAGRQGPPEPPNWLGLLENER